MDKHYFNIIESDQEVTVEVYGTIGESWWDEGVTFKGVSDQLKGIASGTKKVTVKINSYGGDVNDALAIFELLRSMGDRVTTECVGFCASAATIIAMAGHVRRMSSYGLFLVHKCSSWVAGNENELEAELESQRKVNDRIVQIYADVTGTDKAKLEALMEEDNGNGIWLNIDEAMEYGFITEALNDLEDPKEKGKKAFYQTMFKNLFNNHKNHSDMKKSIIAFAALAALLAINEVEGKDNKALFDDDQLKKINDRMEELQKQADAEKQKADDLQKKLDAAKEAAETAKQEHQDKVDELQKKIDEQKAVIDKIPAGEQKQNGKDTETKDDFQSSYEESEMFKEALAKM